MSNEDRAEYDEWLRDAYRGTERASEAARSKMMEAVRAEVGGLVAGRDSVLNEASSADSATTPVVKALRNTRFPFARYPSARVAIYALAGCALIAIGFEIIQRQQTSSPYQQTTDTTTVVNHDRYSNTNDTLTSNATASSLTENDNQSINASTQTKQSIDPSQQPSAPHTNIANNSTASHPIEPLANHDSTITTQASPTHEPQTSSARKTYAQAIEQLDNESAKIITSVLDSTIANNLPVASLMARVQEGIQRGVPPARIIVVARNYASALKTARTALGTTTSPKEIQLGAEAVLAGASGSVLQELRTARPNGALSEPLLALTDMATHGVPPRSASSALASLMSRGDSDASVMLLRTTVVGDILKGASPTAALAKSAQQQALGRQPTQRSEQTRDSLPRPKKASQ